MLILVSLSADLIAKGNELKVLQINIWQEGTMVPGGFEAIGEEILAKKADVVIFSEIRNYKDTDFIQRILTYLKNRGHHYYGESSEATLDVGLIAKFPIERQSPLYQGKEKMGNVLKTHLTIRDKKFLFYSVHLDYTNYACYLPRGYDGVTWKRMDQPIVDPEKIILANQKSKRDETIRDIILDVEHEDKSQFIVIAGDFNEPSHLDWTMATKNMFDHGGAVVPWDCSMMLEEAGFKDAFRLTYPNPVTHPGFTFPAYNKDVPIDKLTWAPLSDERDRIDYIYFLPDKEVILDQVKIVGPVETVAYGKPKGKDSEDVFLQPKRVWPSDHKAVMVNFLIEKR